MKIKKITEVKPERVYAIETSTHTFIADNLAHHNCAGCNTFKSGNLIEYRIGLVKKIGIKRVQWLEDNRRVPKTWKRWELEALLEKYKL